MTSLNINLDPFKAYADKLKRLSAAQLLSAMTAAFIRIGKGDIADIRNNLSGRFDIKSKGLRNSFKFYVDKAGTIHNLTLREFTGWKAAEIFQTGGTITAKNAKYLTIIPAGQRTSSGKRKIGRAAMRTLLNTGKAEFIVTRNGPLIVQQKGGLTKTGKMRKGSRMEILAILRKTVKQQKRLNFFETFTNNNAKHDLIFYEEIDKAITKL